MTDIHSPKFNPVARTAYPRGSSTFAVWTRAHSHLCMYCERATGKRSSSVGRPPLRETAPYMACWVGRCPRRPLGMRSFVEGGSSTDRQKRLRRVRSGQSSSSPPRLSLDPTGDGVVVKLFPITSQPRAFSGGKGGVDPLAPLFTYCCVVHGTKHRTADPEK